ncbi:EamA family transporter [Luteibacter yeojuensis]|uniref:EamA family transporter n=1 Tax=Luteibacter yeojuensis TaxID=345309 RepID=A0A7X5TQU2_9GAMM|nr:EamA family transporter [Luteibacter yeojuensis]NID16173.1 EamA family transporter [Luteibacter yeojuensis]
MKVRHLLLGILVTVIWGSNFSVIEAGLRDLDPFLLTALRFTFTAFPLVFFLRRPRDVGIGALAVYGVLFGVGLWWVVNLAMAKGLSPGLSSLVLQFSAFFTVILSAGFFREHIGAPQWAGMAFAGTGLALVIVYTEGAATTSGMALVLLAAFSWSACNLIVKRCKPRDMLAFVVWSSVFSAPALFLLTWLQHGAAPFVSLLEGLTPRAAGSVLFQSYVTTIFGYKVWNDLMKTYPSAQVAPLSLIVPVSGIATSSLVFDERFDMAIWAGIVAMLFGVAVFVLGPRMLRREPATV